MQLFVLIDALGWEYVESTGFLADLLSYRKALRTVLGFSSGAIPSILTGLPPARHGHWNLFYYDPQHSPFRWLRHFLFLPPHVLEHRITGKILKELGRRVLGMGPLFECCVSPRLLPWFNWVEKGNIYSRGGIPGTHTIFDDLAEAGVAARVYSYHQGSDEVLIRRARQDVETGQAEFFFLYLCEMDAFLHHHCQDPKAVNERLEWYSRELRLLFAAARAADPQASLTVFSDHGMTPVLCHFDLAAPVEKLGLRMPEDYLAVYDATMARFWFFSEDARRRIVDLLQTQTCGRILSEAEREHLGILFPDDRYGEAIFLMAPGWLISRSGFHVRGWLPSGMHGYHPDDRHSDAVFLSNSTPVEPVRAIQDVYRCMRRAAA
jgi:predicted AlkP superfamily pyrophosphatase or phosphodiesterase